MVIVFEIANTLTKVQSSRLQLRVKQKITIQNIGIYRNELECFGSANNGTNPIIF